MAEINRKEFIRALDRVMPAVLKGSGISQMSPFIKLAGSKLYASGMDLSITHPFNIMVNCVVPANELYGIVNKINKDIISIKVNGNQLIIDGENIKSGLVILDESTVFGIPNVRGGWIDLPGNFIDGLNLCLFSVATDTLNKDALTCLNIMNDLVISCDDFRATEYRMNSICPSFLLPLDTARVLVKYDVKRILLKDSWVHFKCVDGTVISCLGMQADYPNIGHVFNVEDEEETSQVSFPDNFGEIVNRISIFSKEEQNMVRRIEVSIDKGITTFRCENKETGWAEEKIKNDYDGKKLCFMANPSFLVELSKLSHDITVSKKSLLIEGDNFRHVMGLVSD